MELSLTIISAVLILLGIACAIPEIMGILVNLQRQVNSNWAIEAHRRTSKAILTCGLIVSGIGLFLSIAWIKNPIIFWSLNTAMVIHAVFICVFVRKF